MSRSPVMSFGAVLLTPLLLAAQLPIPEGPPVDPALRFEAASVKTYDGDGPTRFRMQTSGSLDVTAGSVRMLLQNAYRVRAEHVIGLPGWTDNARYSIVAKAPAGASVPAIPTMLANLLAERFGLVTHREAREIETFDLVLNRDDGRLGPALTRSTKCEASYDEKLCGVLQVGPGIARATGVRLPRLAQTLSQVTARTVDDKTGLDGLYDLMLAYDPSVGVDKPATGDAPHVFTALREQLGLRLVSQRGTAQLVVVDRIERPTVD